MRKPGKSFWILMLQVFVFLVVSVVIDVAYFKLKQLSAAEKNPCKVTIK